MSEPDAAEEYADFAAEIADQIESFLVALREIARGEDTGSTLSLLLLEISQLALPGAARRHQRCRPGRTLRARHGTRSDVEELRERLARLLAPVDDYVEIVDPMDPDRGADGFLISGDLASIASAFNTAWRTTTTGEHSRRCGGGSSPTCRRGGQPAAGSFEPCTR